MGCGRLHGAVDTSSELVSCLAGWWADGVLLSAWSWGHKQRDGQPVPQSHGLAQGLTWPAVAQVQLLGAAHGEQVSSVAWSQRGTYLAAGGEGGAVSIHDAATVSAPARKRRAHRRRSRGDAGAVEEQWANQVVDGFQLDAAASAPFLPGPGTLSGGGEEKLSVLDGATWGRQRLVA